MIFRNVLLALWVPSTRFLSVHRCLPPYNEGYTHNCKKVIESQPCKLVVPVERLSENFANWAGEIVTLSEIPRLLPFVDRQSALVNMLRALKHNNGIAHRIATAPHAVRSLILVGCSAHYGAGKTSIGEVLNQCLRHNLEPGRRVISYHTDQIDASHVMWKQMAMHAPGMEGLQPKIVEEFDWHLLVKETTNYLTANNLHLFLHMDSFEPFDETGKQENSLENFYECWRCMLMPLLKSPRISLYISGRLPYLDYAGLGHLGNPPCKVWFVQLGLFSESTVHDALRRIFIPTPPAVVPAATLALSEALDTALRMTAPGSGSGAQESGAREIARRVYELTGGVPGFVEHALHALLSDSAVYSALFHGHHTSDLSKHLHSLFLKSGAAYEAVRLAALRHFGVWRADKLLEEAGPSREKHVAGLLLLAFLQGRPWTVGPDVLSRLDAGKLDFAHRKNAAFLLDAAQYWGIHRHVDREEKSVRFPVPAAVMEGLKPTLWRIFHDLPVLLRDLRNPAKPEKTRQDSVRDVRAALVFHRLQADVVGHHTWLRVGQSSAVAGATLLSDRRTGAATFRSWDRSDGVQLPCLPRIGASGGWGCTLDTARKITYSGRSNRADQRSCTPRVAGKLISRHSDDAFHLFAAAPGSASADFIVRYGDEVTHLQVRETGDLTVEKLLTDCGRVAAMAKGAADLRHTLVWVMTQGDGGDGAIDSVAGLTHLLAGHASAQRIASAVASGQVTRLPKEGAPMRRVKSEGEVDSSTQNQKPNAEEKNICHAVKLLRKGKLHVVALGDEDRDEFLKYNRIARNLLSD